ncbi:hypothetical protein LYSHEL_25010 [Lysobacter helvus]|uniref:Haemolysin activator HlyB C-terminal domain-containing protein n=2 Tax=Lysobacteraceae TaxID=32033 RepID=A0ABN6FUU2_9GAMM|nr:hypothetical protein LYSCAS_25010 [Lysobacter caseinilyticus]BCT96630.1 hypothetical protein LYSHEL_25010 [Lysobacter helvus]
MQQVSATTLPATFFGLPVEPSRNERQTAQVSIVPADETGWSWIDVKVQRKLPIGGSIGLDNSGANEDAFVPKGDNTSPPGYGRFKTTLGASLRGIGAETWSFGGTRRHYYDGYADFEDSRSVAVSIPAGFWDFELRRGDSRYVKEIESIFTSYGSEGKSNDQSLKVGHTVSRSKRGKTDVSLRIQRKDSENFINGTRIDANSKVYTDLTLGMSRVDQLWGGSLYVDFNWSRGTKWLGANNVVIDPREGHTPALYYKYAGNVSWSRPIKFGDRRFDYALRSGWQYSPRKLLAANQLSIGDEYTVRGFKGASVSGDRGIYLSNTVSMPINRVLTAFVGADIGVVDSNHSDKRHEAISGFALGLRGNWKHASFSITHAEPMQNRRDPPADPRNPPPDNARDVLYATATLRF